MCEKKRGAAQWGITTQIREKSVRRNLDGAGHDMKN
jgi:hypothetical protein